MNKSPIDELIEILSRLVLRALVPYPAYLNAVEKYVVRTLGGAKVPHLYSFIIIIYFNDWLVGCRLLLFIFLNGTVVDRSWCR